MTRDLLPQALERARLIESDPEADDLTRAEILALAAVAERARGLARHAKDDADTPFTNGLHAGALLVLGELEFPPEWRP